MAYGKILTGLLDHFLDIFFEIFLDQLLDHLYRTILLGGGRPLVLSVFRSRRQTFVTEEGVEDELLVCRKGWEVVVLVTATDKYIACVYSPAFDLVVP